MKRSIGLLAAVSAVHYSHALVPFTRNQPQQPASTMQTYIKSVSPFRLSTARALRFNVSLLVKRTRWKIRLAIRLIHLILLFGPVIATLPIYLIRTANLAMNLDEEWWPALLTTTVQYAGPSFIKLGQYFSTRPDILPKEICKLLTPLQSDTHTVPLATIIPLVIHDDGTASSPHGVPFASISLNPIGSGAVAQVHKATISCVENGSTSLKDVVVKLVHRSARERIELDMEIVAGVVWVVESIVPGAIWWSLSDEVRVFKGMMMEQLDMRHEAHNLERFRENFKDNSGIMFPEPIIDLTTRDMLVEEFIPGLPMADLLSLADSPFHHELSRVGLSSFLEMLTLHNFIHADLHPGNILVRFNPPPVPTPESALLQAQLQTYSKPQLPSLLQSLADNSFTPQLVYIDAGLTTILTPRNHSDFLDLFKQLTLYDGRAVTHLLISRSSTPHTVINQPYFEAEMCAMMEDVQGDLDMGEMLIKCLELMRGCRVRMQGDFVNVCLACVYDLKSFGYCRLCEGVGKGLDCEIDLLRESRLMLMGNLFKSFGKRAQSWGY